MMREEPDLWLHAELSHSYSLKLKLDKLNQMLAAVALDSVRVSLCERGAPITSEI